MYKLCYIDGAWAYFTKKPIIGKDKQWGDDWNDAPFDMNASPPYEDSPGDIVRVAFRSELQTPADYHYNAPYSVEQINNGIVPWLCDYYGHLGLGEEANNTKIMAGCSLEDFITIVMANGGEIYIKVHENDSLAERMND
jgi:hypothetical protein